MHTILIAIGERRRRSNVAVLLERRPEWSLRTVSSGREALETLNGELVDLLITDSELPDASPVGFLPELQRRFPDLPVMLISEEELGEVLVSALRFGAADFVPSSTMARDLGITVSKVFALCERSRISSELLERRSTTETTFELGNDPALFSRVITHIQDELERFLECRLSERVNAGIAVEEALDNAMVHGNLEIDPVTRDEGPEAYARKISERREQAPFKHRQISLTCAFSREAATFRVADEGPGFDIDSLPKPLNPENLGRTGGRGLLLIWTFMDEVHFNEAGNEIRMVKKRKTSQP